MLTLIVARAADGAIGRDGTIPWHIPEDLGFFKRETLGGALIMGRHTWESLPVKPLTSRLNIVVSRQADVAETVVPSVEAARALARERGYRRLYGMGGAGIYEALLPVADRLLISEVATEVPDADTHFPRLDPDAWRLIGRTRLRADDPACVLHEYLRQI